MIGDRERDLVETLGRIREYVRNQLRITISKIYLDWSAGGLIGCLTQEFVLKNLPSEQASILSPLIWISIFAVIWLDSLRGFSRIKVMLKLAGREDMLKEFQKDRWKSIISWIIASLAMFPIYYLLTLLGCSQPALLTAIMFVGMGNVLMWASIKKPLEALFVGIALIASTPLLAILSPDIAEISGCLLISLLYALAGISAYFRWRP